MPDINLSTELRKMPEVLCYTRNLTGTFDSGRQNEIIMKKAGSLLTEVFLSEQERRIHINAGG